MAADDVGVISGLYTGISSGDWIKGAIDAYIMGKIKYGLYTDGIKVQHPFKPEKTITWEQIQEICICYSFSIQRLKCGYVVIAFVK